MPPLNAATLSPRLKLSTGCLQHHSHTLNSADLTSFSPLAFAHVGFGLIYAESFDHNQDVAKFWLGVRQFLIIKLSSPPKPLKPAFPF